MDPTIEIIKTFIACQFHAQQPVDGLRPPGRFALAYRTMLSTECCHSQTQMFGAGACSSARGAE